MLAQLLVVSLAKVDTDVDVSDLCGLKHPRAQVSGSALMRTRCHSGEVQVIGVDLASADNNTALAVLTQESRTWRLTELRCPCDDQDITTAVNNLPSSGRAGFDCPVGWPASFVHFIADHSAGAQRPVPAKADLLKRCTDQRVAELVAAQTNPPIRLTPLSVSSDRIAIPAWRMAHLERQLLAGAAPDRSGTGLIAEVYPAAALAIWQLPHRGYKGRDGRSVREEILAGITHRAGTLLNLGDYGEQLLASDHCLDALLSALVTVAIARNRLAADSIPRGSNERELAATEGWIQLPAPDLAAVLG